MDEFELISKAVGTIAFPIVCCIWMATTGKSAVDKLAKSNDNLADAIAKFGEAAGKHSALLEIGRAHV